MLCGVGVSRRILYSINSYLYVSCSGSITLVVDIFNSLLLLLLSLALISKLPIGILL